LKRAIAPNRVVLKAKFCNDDKLLLLEESKMFVIENVQTGRLLI